MKPAVTIMAGLVLACPGHDVASAADSEPGLLLTSEVISIPLRAAMESHRAASTLIRCHVVLCYWLRRRSMRIHWRITWSRNAFGASAFVGTA
jgi:hypothetical protein